jgi:splicing factor 3A subunit 1
VTASLADIPDVIDKTANHVSKSPQPQLLEDKIREQLKTDPKFAFLNDEDPYHGYYRYMVEKMREDAEDLAKGIIPAAKEVKKKPGEILTEEEMNAYEPKGWEFKVDMPGVTAQDL